MRKGIEHVSPAARARVHVGQDRCRRAKESQTEGENQRIAIMASMVEVSVEERYAAIQCKGMEP